MSKLTAIANRLLKPSGIELRRLVRDDDRPWDHTFLTGIEEAKKGADPNDAVRRAWGTPDWLHYYDSLVKPGSSVCEIGPGVGRWTDPILPRVGKIYLADYSRHVCNFWRAKKDPRIEVIHSANCRLDPVPDNSVDVFMSWDVFVHLDIEQFYAYLLAARRVLKPGGTAIIDFLSIPNQTALDWFKNQMKTSLLDDDVVRSIFRFHDVRTIQMLAEDLGFSFTHVVDKWPTHVICTLRKPD